MKIRAKMHVVSVTKCDWGGEELLLRGVHEEGHPENNSFAQATPSAEMKMCVNNPEAQGVMKAGANFYVDFTPAP